MNPDLADELERQGLEHELLMHRRTVTARDEATAVGIPPGEVAKTVVLVTDDGYVRAVVPASRRLDTHKARAALGGGSHTRLATEEELGAAYPGFELGAVPPFAGPAGDRVIVDRRLAELDSIMVEAGVHDHSLRMRTTDLLRISGAEVADISTD
jgi:Ala-tRNA(Pro) deacylase